MYAALTTTKGRTDDQLGTAAVVAEEMYGWLSDMDGFEGLFMLVDEETETTLVVSLWESKEIADHHERARLQFRDRITATVNVQVQETVGYEVAFAELTAPNAPRD